MAQDTKSHRLLTARPERLLIEKYALLTESASDLRGRLEEWYDYYQPTTPGECELLELAVMSSVQRRRVLAQMTELVNQKIRTAFFDFDCAQEDEVERYRAMLRDVTGRGDSGPETIGVRHTTLDHALGTSGIDSCSATEPGTEEIANEAINCQGARATPPESLSESEAGYLTWLYCLMTHPAPKDKDFAAVGQESWTPPALYDREPRDWLGETPVCRKILQDMVHAGAGVVAAA